MFIKFNERLKKDEKGFTLIELLVVILIIAILAAIAIPVFLNQRKKGWRAQSQSSLKDAALAEETYATDNNGSYTFLLSDLTAADVGFNTTQDVTIAIAAGTVAGSFCLTATHGKLPAGDAWLVSTYYSENGLPLAADTCA